MLCISLLVDCTFLGSLAREAGWGAFSCFPVGSYSSTQSRVQETREKNQASHHCVVLGSRVILVYSIFNVQGFFFFF